MTSRDHFVRRRAVYVAALLTCVLSSIVHLSAQTASASPTATVDDAIEAIQRAADFVKDVEFTEDDVDDLIANWNEMTLIEGATVEREQTLGLQDLVDHPDYVDFCRRNRLDPTGYAKKSIRIMLSLMARTMPPSVGDASQTQSQIDQLERLRVQLPDEAREQVEEQIRAAMEAIRGASDLFQHLPEPTEREAAILDARAGELDDLVRGRTLLNG